MMVHRASFGAVAASFSTAGKSSPRPSALIINSLFPFSSFEISKTSPSAHAAHALEISSRIFSWSVSNWKSRGSDCSNHFQKTSSFVFLERGLMAESRLNIHRVFPEPILHRPVTRTCLRLNIGSGSGRALPRGNNHISFDTSTRYPPSFQSMRSAGIPCLWTR